MYLFIYFTFSPVTCVNNRFGLPSGPPLDAIPIPLMMGQDGKVSDKDLENLKKTLIHRENTRKIGWNRMRGAAAKPKTVNDIGGDNGDRNGVGDGSGNIGGGDNGAGGENIGSGNNGDDNDGKNVGIGNTGGDDTRVGGDGGVGSGIGDNGDNGRSRRGA